MDCGDADFLEFETALLLFFMWNNYQMCPYALEGRLFQVEVCVILEGVTNDP
jgi:hypothetical protein